MPRDHEMSSPTHSSHRSSGKNSSHVGHKHSSHRSGRYRMETIAPVSASNDDPLKTQASDTLFETQDDPESSHLDDSRIASRPQAALQARTQNISQDDWLRTRPRENHVVAVEALPKSRKKMTKGERKEKALQQRWDRGGSVDEGYTHPDSFANQPGSSLGAHSTLSMPSVHSMAHIGGYPIPQPQLTSHEEGHGYGSPLVDCVAGTALPWGGDSSLPGFATVRSHGLPASGEPASPFPQRPYGHDLPPVSTITAGLSRAPDPLNALSTQTFTRVAQPEDPHRYRLLSTAVPPLGRGALHTTPPRAGYQASDPRNTVFEVSGSWTAEFAGSGQHRHPYGVTMGRAGYAQPPVEVESGYSRRPPARMSDHLSFRSRLSEAAGAVNPNIADIREPVGAMVPYEVKPYKVQRRKPRKRRPPTATVELDFPDEVAKQYEADVLAARAVQGDRRGQRSLDSETESAALSMNAANEISDSGMAPASTGSMYPYSTTHTIGTPMDRGASVRQGAESSYTSGSIEKSAPGANDLERLKEAYMKM